jgi:hypothetical protein
MLRAVAACCICLLAAPATALAEWHITPTIGLTFAGKTTLQDFEHATGKVHPELGIIGTYLTGGIFGAEAIGTLTPGFFETGKQNLIDRSRSTALMGNIVITVPRHWAEYTLRPFASGGFGLMRTSQHQPQDFSPVTSNVAGFNIGGGAVGYFSRSTGVRFEFRYFSNLHGVDQRSSDQGTNSVGNVHLRYMTASVGFVFRL